MQSNYYFIISYLPEISFSEKEDYTKYSYLFDEVNDSLSESDSLSLRYLRYPVDNSNLISLLMGEEDGFIPGGNYSLDELKYEIKSMDTIPSYMRNFFEVKDEFMETRDGKTFLLQNFFYEEAFEIKNRFLRKWFAFDRDLKNVLTALECRKHGEPIERREITRVDQRPGQRLIGDYEVTHNILTSKSLDYSLSGMLDWMMDTLDLDSSNLLEYERKILYLKLNKLMQFYNEDHFNIESLLAYFIRLQLYIRWSLMSEEKGKKFYEDLMENTGRVIQEIL